MKKEFLWIHKRIGALTIGLLAVFMIGIGLLMSSYALSEPVPKISFSSQTLSYEKNNPGSWNVEKSAKWVGLGKARITFQVDTVLKSENPNTDVILVLDISGSMTGDKLDRVKRDSISLLNALLSNRNNRAALITFDTESKLVSDFTNNKSSLIEKINQLEAIGTTNYYQSLVHVDEILKNYSKEEDTECVVLFLTDGYPNEDTPNQIGEYKYLKSEYPWLKIHGIQYEMGEEVLEPIKEISDNQFIADMTTLNNVLFDASVVPTPYENFILMDFIDNEYFDLKNISNIQSSFGTVNLENENGIPKVTWDLSGLSSGQTATLTIDIDLKEGNIEDGNLYPTNKSSEVVSQIDGDKEDVTTDETPVLVSHYNVIYEGNAPSGCSVRGVPGKSSHRVFETVEKSNAVPTCEGYQFKGWMIVTEGVKKLNDDYFIMPSKDVTLRAEWGKMGLSKSVKGEVYVQKDPILKRVGFDSYNKELWQYKDSITRIVIEGDQTSKEGSKYEWDISEAKDESVRGVLVPNSDNPSTYTAYIQGSEGEVIANPDSSYLFYSFTKLTTIEGLGLLNTSQVTNMGDMFSDCQSLTSLDLSSWDTSHVTNMSSMFSDCKALTSLEGLNGWNTGQVTRMNSMFYSCNALSNLDLSSWTTSQVTGMSYMFYNCDALSNLDLSSWNTGQVTNMGYMFYGCNLITLNLSGWDTSQVTNMGYMFYNCHELVNVGNLSGWNTGQVKDIDRMFYGCQSLTSLDLSNWNTSQVTSMDYLFYHCYDLASVGNLSGWNTSQVTDMSYMFLACRSLISLDLSSWDTHQVTRMNCMFSGCSGLTSVGDLSKWSTSQVTSMGNMFYGCQSFISLDLSSWNTGQVTDMSGMFSGCSGLTSLNLNNWDTGQVTDMSEIFRDCSGLTSVNLSNWDTSQATNMALVFSGCSGLTNLNLSNWDTSQVTNMNQMFDGCTALRTITYGEKFIHNSSCNVTFMFYDCPAPKPPHASWNGLTYY